MIIQCPSCFAKYFIDKSFLQNSVHKKFRCTKCQYQWSYADNKSTTLKARNVAKKSIPTTRANASLFRETRIDYAFVLNFFVVAMLIVVPFIIFHEELPSRVRARIYNSLPFKLANIIDTRGMLFENLKIENNEYKSQQNVSIKGFVANNSNKLKIVPPIRICLGSEQEKCLKSYYVRSNGKVIEPKSREYFYYKIMNVSSEADRVIIDMGNKIELMLR